MLPLLKPISQKPIHTMKFDLSGRSAATLLLAALLGGYTAQGIELERLPAFPGAEGFGRYVDGGRRGYVYHVTSLGDRGTGTLREALSKTGPRTIVFDVSGTIHLESGLKIPEYTTIAGQTAPGDGICIADYPVTLGSNTIVRFMRFRLGNKNVLEGGADGWDGLTAMDSRNVIVDHCSVSWSIDECCSILGNVNSTLQWSIVSQSLVNSGHSKGAHGYGGNWGGSGASFHHNLVAHHGSRTPRLGPRVSTQLDERMDMRNNVIYNFGGNGCYGGEGMNVNIINNYYKPGPATPGDKKGKRIAGVGIRTNSYCNTYPAYAPALHLWGTYLVEGNVNSKYSDVAKDNWGVGFLDQIDKSASATDGTWNAETEAKIKRSEPVPFPATTTHTAEKAYDLVTSYAGCSISYDWVDRQMIDDTLEGKATSTGRNLSKGLINSQEDNKPSGAGDDWSAWPVLNSTAAPVDTDKDGMPDEWETARGLNPNDASDRNLCDESGYTMLEVYLAELVEDITAAQEAEGWTEGYRSTYELPETFEVSMNTKDGAGWYFNDGLFWLTGGNYVDCEENGYFQMPVNRKHTLWLPAGAAISKIKFEGRGFRTTASYSDASLVELNGQEFEQGTYTLPKSASETGSFEVAFPKPVKGQITFTFKGNVAAGKITLSTDEAAAVETVEAGRPEGDDAPWYNLQGIPVSPNPTTPGIYIHAGKKVLVK